MDTGKLSKRLKIMEPKKFRSRVNRLVRLKVKEIVDGCLKCQGLIKDIDGHYGCSEHADLINDMYLHPKKYAKELLKPGDLKEDKNDATQ